MWFSIYIAVCMTGTVLASSHICPDSDEPIDFSTEENVVEYVRQGYYVDLVCCGTGFDYIDWYKWNNFTSDWEEYYAEGEYDKEPSFSEHRQILNIKSAEQIDAGRYKCELANDYDEETVSREIVLHVQGCDYRARGPYAIAPIPRDQEIMVLGGNVTFPCAGYFGCADDTDFRVVGWFVQDKNTGRWMDIRENGNERYTQKHFTINNAIVGTNLTISNVHTEDVNSKFMCVMTSSKAIQGETRLTVQINYNVVQETSEITKPATVTVAVVVGVCSLFSVVLLVAIVKMRKKCHEIRGRKFKRLPAYTSAVYGNTTCEV